MHVSIVEVFMLNKQILQAIESIELVQLIDDMNFMRVYLALVPIIILVWNLFLNLRMMTRSLI